MLQSLHIGSMTHQAYCLYICLTDLAFMLYVFERHATDVIHYHHGETFASLVLSSPYPCTHECKLVQITVIAPTFTAEKQIFTSSCGRNHTCVWHASIGQFVAYIRITSRSSVAIFSPSPLVLRRTWLSGVGTTRSNGRQSHPAASRSRKHPRRTAAPRVALRGSVTSGGTCSG